MTTIQYNAGSDFFKIDGATYKKHFVAVLSNNAIRILNVYDSRLVISNFKNFDTYEVVLNEVVQQIVNAEELLTVLNSFLFTPGATSGGSTDPSGLTEAYTIDYVSIADQDSGLPIKTRILNELSARVSFTVSGPRVYYTSYNVGETFITERYLHLAGLGTFGTAGEDDFPAGDFSPNIARLDQAIVNLDTDPNDLDPATSIESSINQDPTEYLISQTRIFRRTISGEARVFLYIGSQEIIGGSQTDVVSDDFEDITSNTTAPGEAGTETTPVVNGQTNPSLSLSNHEGVFYREQDSGQNFDFPGVKRPGGEAFFIVDTGLNSQFPGVNGESIYLLDYSGDGSGAPEITFTLGGVDFIMPYIDQGDDDATESISQFVANQATQIAQQTGYIVSQDADQVVFYGYSSQGITTQGQDGFSVSGSPSGSPSIMTTSDPFKMSTKYILKALYTGDLILFNYTELRAVKDSQLINGEPHRFKKHPNNSNLFIAENNDIVFDLWISADTFYPIAILRDDENPTIAESYEDLIALEEITIN